MLVSSSNLAAGTFNFVQSMVIANANPTCDFVVRGVSTDELAVTTSSGFEIQPTHCLNEAFRSALIHLPAIQRNLRSIVNRSERLLDWIPKQHRLSTIFTAVTTGVYFMAGSGLLDNKPVSSDWYSFDQLKRSYPNTLLQ